MSTFTSLFTYAAPVLPITRRNSLSVSKKCLGRELTIHSTKFLDSAWTPKIDRQKDFRLCLLEVHFPEYIFASGLKS
jgi:hypothetical protein